MIVLLVIASLVVRYLPLYHTTLPHPELNIPCGADLLLPYIRLSSVLPFLQSLPCVRVFHLSLYTASFLTAIGMRYCHVPIAHRLLQTDFFLLSSHFISFHFRWLDLLGIIGGYWQLSTKRRKRVQNGPFLGNDERLFWQRAEDRNRATASLYDQLGLACYEAMEAFVEYKPL